MSTLLRRPPRPLPWSALALAALAFALVLLLGTRSAGPPPPGAGPTPRWTLSGPIARERADAAASAGEEERLLAAFRAARADPARRAAFLASLAGDWAAVAPGRRAVLGEALLEPEEAGAPDADARATVTALWSLAELEAAPEGTPVVAVDAAAGTVLAARAPGDAADDAAGPRVATLALADVASPIGAPASPAATPRAGRAPLLRALAAALVAAVLVLLAALLARRGESPRAARRREDFFYAVTHALKTPLATIALCAETLQEHGRDDPAAVPRFAGMIRDESERLQARIHQVLQLASGRIPATFGAKRFDAASALPAIVAEYTTGAREAGVRLVLWAEGADWLVEGSVELFAQALGGLVENAIRHGAPGVVLVAARAERGVLRIAVQDRGPGVPAEAAGRIFEPFVRGQKGGTGRGTGLGLALVRQSVEALGGTVRLDPRESPGATFRVELPLADRRARRSHAEEDGADGSRRAAREATA